MTEKRFHYDWKTGRFKDTLLNSCATSNMRILETQINNACFNYEKKIRELKKENEQLKQFKQNVFGLIDKSLEKDKHDYEMTYEDYLNGRIEVLENLKKELSDD